MSDPWELNNLICNLQAQVDAHAQTLERVRVLESRLAEVAPVVEAAEAVADTMFRAEWTDQEGRLFTAVQEMRAARSLRGAGEGGAGRG